MDVHLLGRDHPRRCGENRCGRYFFHRRRGSPPQVRGKPDDRTVIVGTNGITPAGAGKTYVKYDLRQAAPDHPRRCGENCHVPVRFLRTVGSPPQVRGKLLIYAQIGRLRGITPAGAGKTSSRLSHTSLPQDHPRRCGENCEIR